MLTDGSVFAPRKQRVPVDTSGAGDAFNAGYISARLGNQLPQQAAAAGNLLAGWVIGLPGAIPPMQEEAYPLRLPAKKPWLGKPN